MGLGQYDSPGEYCGPHTASSVFSVLGLTGGTYLYLLPTGSEEKGVLWAGSIPVAILLSCEEMKTIGLK